MGINLKRRGVDVEMDGLAFFITLQFNHIYCVCVCVCGGGGGEGGNKVPFLLVGSLVF